jgi:hypothetical protein
MARLLFSEGRFDVACREAELKRSANHLQISIILVRQRHGGSVLHLFLVLGHQLGVDLDLRRRESWRGDELERGVADQLASEPEERLLEIVVGLGGDVVVLKVLLAVEGDRLGLDFSLLDIDLVAAQHDRNVFADANQVTCHMLLVLKDAIFRR